jgi:hypothetical protein
MMTLKMKMETSRSKRFEDFPDKGIIKNDNDKFVKHYNASSYTPDAAGLPSDHLLVANPRLSC